MDRQKIKKKFDIKSQKSGFLLILAAVLSISVILFSHTKQDYESKIKQINENGFAKVRLLAQIPYDQLVHKNGENRVFALTEYNLRDPNFAYSAVTNLNGYTEVSVSNSNVLVPFLKPPADPSSWLAVKKLGVGSNGKTILDFHAPIFSNGELKGFFRIGYYEPAFGLEFEAISSYAPELLLLLLITTLAIYFVRRNTASIESIGNKIENAIEQNQFSKLEINPSGELTQFMGNFNKFMSSVQNRISDLNTNNRELEAASKLLTYQQTKIISVLHALPEGMIVFDESGNISFTNTKVLALFRATNEEELSNDLSWCDNKKVRSLLARIKANTLGNYINENIEFVPDSTPDRTYMANAYPLYSGKEEHVIKGTMVLFRDVTEEKMAKNARGEFIAHVAHELKNPLNVLSMYSESLLREDGESYEFRIEAVNVIQDEVERLTLLISNLLNITKIEMGSLEVERQRTKLRDLLVDIHETFKRFENDKNIKIELDVPNEVSSLYVDKDLIRIAINNLLTNAIKYSNNGGKISLSVEEIGNQVKIYVRDEGIGIAPEEQALIFDRFYRSESEDVRARVGHGLGLSLVRDIVHLHNGRVEVNSELNKGTEFIISLENNMEMLGKAV